MIARSFQSVMWVAAIGAAALICYMFSLRVAEERAGLAELEGQIRRAEQSIRTLRTELSTRSRVHQLQHWASTDFGFASPTSGQFLQDEITLASLDVPAVAPALESPVQLASAAAPAPETRKPVQAVAAEPAPATPAVRRASAPAPADPALLRRAAVVDTSATAARTKPRKPAAAGAPPTRTTAATTAATTAKPRTTPTRTATRTTPPRSASADARPAQSTARAGAAEPRSGRAASRPR